MTGTAFDRFYQEMLRICEVPQLDRDFSLKDRLDSLARAEIIVTVEQEFGRELTNEEILSLKTYGDLEDLVKAKIGG